MDEYEISEQDELRLNMFGARSRCQEEIGITCEECRYHDACIGKEELQ